MPRGYDRALYILPFDHRGSFQAKMFGWKSPLSEAQAAEISRAKEFIYDGFNAALASGLSREKTGVLVDEQFGAGIHRDATSKNIITACPAEKSGQEEFDLICLSEQAHVCLLNSQIALARDSTPQRRSDTCS
jgi:5-dehydro-2-deoxygluconokinase